MADLRRLEGERVFCHQCTNEWDRASGGLTCPRCEGEFTEILSPGDRPQRDLSPPAADPPPPIPRHPFPNRNPFADHNPWADAPDPGEGDITTIEFNTPHGGRGTFSYSSRTYTSGRGGNTMGQMPGFPFGPLGFGGQQGPIFGGMQTRGSIFPRDQRAQPGPQPGDMQDLFGMIFQTMNQGAFAQPRRPGEVPPNPFQLLGTLLNPLANGRAGDAVWSQEAFDRIVEQLAEQNGQSTAPGPASESAIKHLPTKKVEKEMMGSDGTAECSICMDNVELGSVVTELPCSHWFHGDCVVAWLKEHDTCPHCRKPITNPDEQQQQPGASRRRSRRASSVASPYGADGTRENPFSVPDSPSALREHRQYYYGSRRDPEEGPDHPRRHSSSRHERHSNSRHNSSSGNAGGGVTGWIRNRMGFGDG